MEITLPESGKILVLSSLPRKTCLALLQKEKERVAVTAQAKRGDEGALAALLNDDFLSEREQAVRARYPEMEPWDVQPNRDIVRLIEQTWVYSLGYPEEEIKNLYRSGASQQTQTD